MSDGARLRMPAGVLGAGGGAAAVLALVVHDAALLLLAVPLLVAPLWALATAPPPPRPLRVEWTAGGAGREVRVRGRIALPPGVAPDATALEWPPTAPLQADAPPALERRPGEIGFRWRLTAPHPGLGRLALPEARWEEPLGLVDVPLRVVGDPLPIDRFPPEVARMKARHLRRTDVAPGEVRSRERGRGGDFFALRPAAPHDTPRQINWRATARAGALRSNEFLKERTGDLLIVLDLRPSPLGWRRDTELLSMSRAAALGIASAFLKDKSRVGLATFGEFASVVPLGTGRLQSYRVRRALESAEIGPVAGPAERLAVSLRRYFPPGIGTLVLSPLVDADAPLLLAHLRRRGFDAFVLSASPVALLLGPEPSKDRAGRVAGRLLRLARRQQLAAAWREAPVIDWDDAWSLGPLVRFLGRPPDRRTGAA